MRLLIILTPRFSLDKGHFGGIITFDNLEKRDWWSTWETMRKRLVKATKNRTPGFSNPGVLLL